jgi:hypothetical protein
VTCPILWFQAVQLGRDAVACIGFLLGLLLWRRLDRAHRLIAVWLLTAGAMDYLASRLGCHDDSSRRLVVQFWFPLSAPLALGALGAFQGTVTRRDIFRLAGLGYVFVWGFLLLSLEGPGQYPTYTGESHSLLLIGASVITLIRRASLARKDLRHDPGFLLSSALLVFMVPTLFLSAVARNTVGHEGWLHAYFGAQGVITALCCVVMMAAMVMTAQSSRVRGAA